MSEMRQQFQLEEFRQLHEHIRAFEAAHATCFTVSLVACTTLLTATSAWFFEIYRADPGKISAALCYSFLGPALLSVLTLALINSYKTAIYRNGYYIKVFIEEPGYGPSWHMQLVRYRNAARGQSRWRRWIAGSEHGEPAAWMLWTFHAISIGLFVVGLVLSNHDEPWRVATPLPLVIAMIAEHRAYSSNRETIEDTWRMVFRSHTEGQRQPPPAAAGG